MDWNRGLRPCAVNALRERGSVDAGAKLRILFHAVHMGLLCCGNGMLIDQLIPALPTSITAPRVCLAQHARQPIFCRRKHNSKQHHRNNRMANRFTDGPLHRRRVRNNFQNQGGD